MICPSCSGMKATRGIACPGARAVVIPCGRCSGSGEVDRARFEAGERLRELRLAKDLSLREAAYHVHVPPSYWSDAELGRTDNAELLVNLLESIGGRAIGEDD